MFNFKIIFFIYQYNSLIIYIEKTYEKQVFTRAIFGKIFNYKFCLYLMDNLLEVIFEVLEKFYSNARIIVNQWPFIIWAYMCFLAVSNVFYILRFSRFLAKKDVFSIKKKSDESEVVFDLAYFISYIVLTPVSVGIWIFFYGNFIFFIPFASMRIIMISATFLVLITRILSFSDYSASLAFTRISAAIIGILSLWAFFVEDYGIYLDKLLYLSLNDVFIAFACIFVVIFIDIFLRIFDRDKI